MKDKIIKGVITNEETAEHDSFTHYLFCHEFELRTLVKINKVNSYVHPDNSFQIYIDCWGLDGVGGVFEVGLNFTPSTLEERNKILIDLAVDSIFTVKGSYTIITAEALIDIHDPLYYPLCPDFSEEEIREVFRINSAELSEKNREDNKK